MKNLSCNVLTATDSASHNGIQIDGSQLVNASFAASFGDATAAGTLKVQISNDVCPVGYLPDIFVVINWVDLPSATATVTAGASVVIPTIQTSYRWLRVVYTSSSGGSSTINVNMFAISI